MSNSIFLSNLIQLIVLELDSALGQTTSFRDVLEARIYETSSIELESLPNLKISDLELDLPAHVQVKPMSQKSRVKLTLPSLLGTSSIGQLGRVRITIKID